MICITLPHPTEICANVTIEPHLQPLTGEHLDYRTTNREDNARLDVAADGFWRISGQRAFFDVQVFNPMKKKAFLSLTVVRSLLVRTLKKQTLGC